MAPSLSRAKRLRRSALLAACLCAAAAPVLADFEDLGVGARALGMGGAFTGLADDSRAIHYNPAGLAYLRRSEISADYGRYFTNLEDHSNLSAGYFSLVIPMARRKSFDERVKDLRKLSERESAVSASTAAVSPAKGEGKKSGPVTFYNDWGTMGFALSNTSLSGYLSQNTFWVSYGRKLREKVSGGLSIKVLQESYTQNAYTRKDPVFSRGGRSDVMATTMDAGFLYNPAPKLFIGGFASNLNNPNVALNPADRDVLPRIYKLGAALRQKKLNMIVDIVQWDGNVQFRSGVERWFLNRLIALRFGGGFGSRDYKNVSTGFSLNWGNFQLDYALLYPISGLKDTLGNHKLSLVYRFGKPPAHELAVGSVELYYSKLLQEMELLRARLDKSEDERSRLEKVLVEEALSRIKEKVRAEKLEATVAPAGKKDIGAKDMQGLSGQIGGLKTYVVAKGDTLQSVAELFYGKKDRWMDIYNFNKDKVGRGGSLKSGTVLLIPGAGGEGITESSLIKAPEQDNLLKPIGQTLAPLPGKPSPAQPVGTMLAPIRAGSAPAKKEPAAGEPDKKAAAEATYIVQPGDTLSTIAQKFYNDSSRWKDIYRANKDKVEKGSVAPGSTLKIPPPAQQAGEEGGR